MSRAQVMAVARLAGADEFIDKLPQGYDTMIEERGANLSGGQRQRIAIARALAHQSADPDLRRGDLGAGLRERARSSSTTCARSCSNRTVFIIAHRLAAVRDCDIIIGMIDGRLVEAGSHAELFKHPQRAVCAAVGDAERAGRSMNAVRPAPA